MFFFSSLLLPFVFPFFGFRLELTHWWVRLVKIDLRLHQIVVPKCDIAFFRHAIGAESEMPNELVRYSLSDIQLRTLTVSLSFAALLLSPSRFAFLLLLLLLWLLFWFLVFRLICYQWCACGDESARGKRATSRRRLAVYYMLVNHILNAIWTVRLHTFHFSRPLASFVSLSLEPFTNTWCHPEIISTHLRHIHLPFTAPPSHFSLATFFIVCFTTEPKWLEKKMRLEKKRQLIRYLQRSHWRHVCAARAEVEADAMGNTLSIINNDSFLFSLFLFIVRCCGAEISRGVMFSYFHMIWSWTSAFCFAFVFFLIQFRCVEYQSLPDKLNRQLNLRWLIVLIMPETHSIKWNVKYDSKSNNTLGRVIRETLNVTFCTSCAQAPSIWFAQIPEHDSPIGR